MKWQIQNVDEFVGGKLVVTSLTTRRIVEVYHLFELDLRTDTALVSCSTGVMQVTEGERNEWRVVLPSQGDRILYTYAYRPWKVEGRVDEGFVVAHIDLPFAHHFVPKGSTLSDMLGRAYGLETHQQRLLGVA